ncbi:MAG: DEAD/DEAH box helicase [Polyangiales bacterium]
MQFAELNLDPRLLRALTDEGYTTPTPIQSQAIPPALEGRDLLGVAQTGTGKTAAFSLPLLQRLAAKPHAGGRRPIRALILTPTRELAAQIGESLRAYGKHMGLYHTVIFGGVGQGAQEQSLKRGVDVLVATPGRLLDLMGQGFVRLADLEFFILDEADRMLDMGFIHDVKRVIAALPRERQSLFFSATMPPEIVALSSQILRDPVRVEVAPAATTAEKVEQTIFFVEKGDKRALLLHLLQSDHTITRAIVFSRTKHGANRIAETLDKARVSSAAIHGNKSQNARERALAHFKDGSVRVLVATDIAARGIDIDDVSHVINFDLPNVPEQYVHRIGRTARAGASGVSISFCEEEERPYLRDIERLTRQRVPVASGHPYASHLPPPSPTDLSPSRAKAPQPQQGQGRSHAHPRPPQGHPRPQGHGPRGAQPQRPRQGDARRPQTPKPSR